MILVAAIPATCIDIRIAEPLVGLLRHGRF